MLASEKISKDYMEITELWAFTKKMNSHNYSNQTVKTLAKLTLERIIAYIDTYRGDINTELYEDVLKMMHEMEELT